MRLFDDYWGVEYTGLQVSKDPGVWFIYIACIIMTIGLYVTFFISHKKIWIYLAHEAPGGKGPVRISIGGMTHRNRLAFEKEIEHILVQRFTCNRRKTYDKMIFDYTEL
jgi:cytochrome c biogenesis protein